jgi:hypothetical protein
MFVHIAFHSIDRAIFLSGLVEALQRKRIWDEYINPNSSYFSSMFQRHRILGHPLASLRNIFDFSREGFRDFLQKVF